MVSKRLSGNGKTPARVCTAKDRKEFEHCGWGRMNDLSQRNKYGERHGRLVMDLLERLAGEFQALNDDGQNLVEMVALLEMEIKVKAARNGKFEGEALQALARELHGIFEGLDYISGIAKDIDQLYDRAAALCFGDKEKVAKALKEGEAESARWAKEVGQSPRRPLTWASVHAMDDRVLSHSVVRWQLDAPDNGFESLEAAADWVCAQLGIEPEADVVEMKKAA